MNKRIKVIHIVEDLKVGGLEKVIASLVLHLDSDKYDVQVYCLVRGGAIADELTARGVSVRVLHLKSYHDPLQVIALARIIRREAIQLIHSHGYFASTFVRLAAFLTPLPVMVTHVHSTYTQFKKRNFFVDRFLSRFTDRVVCVSRAVQRFVIDDEGIEEQRTCVVYNGADIPPVISTPEERMRRKRQWGIEENDVVIISVASLTENKGYNLLLDAFERASRSRPGLKLLVVGDGPLKEALKSRSADLLIEKKVIFTGEQEEVQPLLQIADLFVLASLYREGLSVALIEASASGLPVVATQVGGIPEIVEEGANGYLVPPGDADRLAGAIERLVRDPDLRKRMGQQGKQVYEAKFTQSKMVRQIENLYDQLIENKTHASKS